MLSSSLTLMNSLNLFQSMNTTSLRNKLKKIIIEVSRLRGKRCKIVPEDLNVQIVELKK